MLSHPEPPPFQLKVMSNIAGSVRDWPFSIPWVSFCWPLILVTHLLLSCTLKKLIIRQHASFSHCLANKLQAAIREVCAKQCVAESCRFFKLAGWVTKWISMTDSNLARGLTPSLGDSEVTATKTRAVRANNFFMSAFAHPAVIPSCFERLIFSLWRRLWPEVFANQTTPGGSTCCPAVLPIATALWIPRTSKEQEVT